MAMDDRRGFIKRLLALAAAAWAWTALSRTADGRWFGGDEDEWITIGKLDDLPEGRKIRIEKATRADSGKTVKAPKLIAERRGREVLVMSTKCTHFGCEVNLKEDGTYLCPCHGAAYDAGGVPTKGPARKPLSWYPAEVADNGDVRVNIGRPLEAAPGAAAGG